MSKTTTMSTITTIRKEINDNIKSFYCWTIETLKFVLIHSIEKNDRKQAVECEWFSSKKASWFNCYSPLFIIARVLNFLGSLRFPFRIVISFSNSSSSFMCWHSLHLTWMKFWFIAHLSLCEPSLTKSFSDVSLYQNQKQEEVENMEKNE